MRWTLIPIVALLAFAAPAQAKQHWQIVHPIVTQPACPVGVPVQMITVFNQANVRPDRLALVERAAVDQSMQLRRWWGTPCVQFAPGGWKLWLKRGPDDSTSGVHYSGPHVFVWTGGLAYEMWSADFTHEIAETLVDPETTGYNVNDIGYQLEVADPVEYQTYPLDGVNVTDFVTPNWYAGATTGTCETTLAGVQCDDPLIAPSPNTGPWDQAGVLRRPWQELDHAVPSR